MRISIRPAARTRVVLPTSVKSERIYDRYQRVAFSAARRVSERTGRPYEEMVEEAAAKLGELAAEWDRFDPRMSCACTWVYTTVYWHLVTLASGFVRRREVELQEECDAPMRVGWLDRLAQELSEEGRSLLQTILEAPAAVVDELRFHPRELWRVRLRAIEYLRGLRWSEERIDAAWTEVQEALS